MGPDNSHCLKHGKGIVNFTEQVFVAQVQTGPDEFEPDGIIYHSRIYTTAKKWGIRREKVTGGAEIKASPASEFEIAHKSSQRIDKMCT